MVVHVAENVVVDVAEEVNVWFNSPIVPIILKRGMLVEHSTVPSAHLMVRLLVHVLHLLLFKHLHRLSI